MLSTGSGCLGALLRPLGLLSGRRQGLLSGRRQGLLSCFGFLSSLPPPVAQLEELLVCLEPPRASQQLEARKGGTVDRRMATQYSALAQETGKTHQSRAESCLSSLAYTELCQTENG